MGRPSYDGAYYIPEVDALRAEADALDAIRGELESGLGPLATDCARLRASLNGPASAHSRVVKAFKKVSRDRESERASALWYSGFLRSLRSLWSLVADDQSHPCRTRNCRRAGSGSTCTGSSGRSP